MKFLKISSEFTYKVQFIKKKSLACFYIGRLIFYPKHFSISIVGLSPL
jgi:hypothetical protein